MCWEDIYIDINLLEYAILPLQERYHRSAVVKTTRNNILNKFFFFISLWFLDSVLDFSLSNASLRGSLTLPKCPKGGKDEVKQAKACPKGLKGRQLEVGAQGAQV